MAIRINGRTIRNIPEQVAKNLHDIDTLDTEVDSVATDIALLAARVAAALAGVFHYKGTVASYADLPSSGMQVGDTYNVLDTGENYTWSGSSWDRLSGIVDLSNYLDKSSANQSIDYTASYDFDIGASVKFDSAGDQYRVMAVGTTLDVAAFNDNQWKSYIAIDSDNEEIDIYKPTFFNSSVNFVDDVDIEGELHVGDNLLPTSANTVDIGSSTSTFKDIYLSGGFNKNASGYKLTLPSTASLTADSELLDTASAQTIAGVKTFYDKLIVKSTNQYARTLEIRQGNNAELYENNNRILVIDGSNVYFPTALMPYSSATINIGSLTGKWKDLYLSGVISDGTNSVSVADLAALVTYAKGQGWIS